MRLKLSKRHRDSLDHPSESRGASDPGYMRSILSQVSATGWAVPGVPGNSDTSPWVYSIGLWASYGHPDLAAFGRPLGQLAVIARTLCRRVADEETISAGDMIDDVCLRRLAIRGIHESWRATSLFRASDRFHGYIRPPMLQIAWADRDGYFPWEQRYEPALADAQPMLWLPVDDHPPGPWTRFAARTKTGRGLAL